MTEAERTRKRAELARKYYNAHKNDPGFRQKIAEQNKRSREKRAAAEAEKIEKIRIQEKTKAESVPEDLSVDSVTKPKRTVVIAQGWGEDGKKVIVERWTADGFPVFRTKVVVCRHYKTRTKALLSARAEGVKLRLYGDLPDDDNN